MNNELNSPSEIYPVQTYKGYTLTIGLLKEIPSYIIKNTRGEKVHIASCEGYCPSLKLWVKEYHSKGE